MLKNPKGTPNGWLVYKYSSFQEFIDEATKPVCENPCETSSREISSHKTRWSGCETWDEARDLMVKGWPEGRERMSNRVAVEADTAQGHNMQPMIEKSVVGFMPNVPAYLAGRPEAMFTMRKRESAAMPIVRIVVERWNTWRLDAAEIERYGLAVAGLVQSIEERGYRVELSVSVTAMSNENSSHVVSGQFPIKRADENVELDRFAFVFAHPAFLRRIAFGWYSTDQERSQKANYGCCHLPNRSERREIEEKCFDENQWHLPIPDMLRHELHSLESANAVMAEWWEAKREGVEGDVEKKYTDLPEYA